MGCLLAPIRALGCLVIVAALAAGWLYRDIEVGARLVGGRLPKDALGPLALALPDHPPIRAAGPVDVVAPGRGEWEIERLNIAGVPVPADALRTLLGRLLNDPGRYRVPVAIPPGVREIRIRPAGAVLFGARRP